MSAKWISSYDHGAPTPEVGSRWVWEPKTIGDLLEVIEVKWNGEEWWVKTRCVGYAPLKAIPIKKWAVVRMPGLDPRSDIGSECWNDLSRFWEACRPVGGPS